MGRAAREPRRRRPVRHRQEPLLRSARPHRDQRQPHRHWFSVEQLGGLVARHRIDDSITKALKPVLRSDLVIVDDIGLLPITVDAAEGLYRLVDAAYERRSVAISSNLHPSGFDELMPRTIATALVDRLMHHAHILVTTGDSVRLSDAADGKGVKPLT